MALVFLQLLNNQINLISNKNKRILQHELYILLYNSSDFYKAQIFAYNHLNVI